MIAAFADTVYYVALFSPRDALHRPSRAFADEYMGRVITSEFVLVEVANFLSRPSTRHVYRMLVETLRSDPTTEIVPASSELFARGYDLFVARPDKDWSLIDCTSFVVMMERGITDALTADEHFVQAGFRRLLGG